jgi:hypothetical protein
MVEYLKVLMVEYLKVLNSRACLRILNSRAPAGPHHRNGESLPGLSLAVEPMAALLVERATHPAGPHPYESVSRWRPYSSSS